MATVQEFKDMVQGSGWKFMQTVSILHRRPLELVEWSKEENRIVTSTTTKIIGIGVKFSERGPIKINFRQWFCMYDEPSTFELEHQETEIYGIDVCLQNKDPAPDSLLVQHMPSEFFNIDYSKHLQEWTKSYGIAPS